MGQRHQMRLKKETDACSCDSADLTGLGLSAAVPLAFIRIAGENSIPVWEAIYSPTQGDMKIVNLITCSVPPVCYFNASTVILCSWVTDLHWVKAKGGKNKQCCHTVLTHIHTQTPVQGWMKTERKRAVICGGHANWALKGTNGPGPPLIGNHMTWEMHRSPSSRQADCYNCTHSLSFPTDHYKCTNKEKHSDLIREKSQEAESLQNHQCVDLGIRATNKSTLCYV